MPSQVLDWLAGLDDNTHPYPTKATAPEPEIPTTDTKRKREADAGIRHFSIPSPPFSASMDRSELTEIEAAEEQQQRKRLRISEAEDPDQQTPRARERAPLTTGMPNTHRLDHPNSSAPSIESAEYSASSTRESSRGGPGSAASGRTSPRKRLRNLALQDDGFVTKALVLSSVPPELESIVSELMAINNGVGVVSNKRRSEIETLVDSQDPGKLFFLGLNTLLYPHDDNQQQKREALGPTPSVEDVLSIAEWAAICAAQPAEEAQWNSAVHFPILSLAVNGRRRMVPRAQADQRTQVGISQCTTGRIVREYLPAKETSGKQVDFCFHLDVDETAEERIDSIRASLPMQTINHTDLEGLITRPIALSFESKRLDSINGSVEAKLQIGMWHAAQWKLLKRLVGQQQQPQSLSPLSPSSLPAFLPAVIISGQDWAFAATTQKQGKTVCFFVEHSSTPSPYPQSFILQAVSGQLLTCLYYCSPQILWTDFPFGHTRDAVGVYKLICGLQRLKVWAEKEYWPWYRHVVLGLQESVSGY